MVSMAFLNSSTSSADASIFSLSVTQTTLARLRARVDGWMRETGDPRTNPADDSFDRFPYLGAPPKAEK